MTAPRPQGATVPAGTPTATPAERASVARQLIGEDAPDDYVISPASHAARYAESAPALSEILGRSATRIVAAEFERCDGIAVEAQRAFKRNASLSNIAVLVTASLGAVVMLLGLLHAPDWALIAVGGFGTVTGAFGAFLTQQIKHRRMLERWMTARADAESHRYEYFQLVTGAQPDEDEALGSLQLEYFRRYELDTQLRYYDARQRDHERRSDRTATFGAAAAFFAALSTGVAGFVGGNQGTEWAGLAAFGILGTALASYAAGRDAIGQDARNAERYGRTRSALVEFSKRLDDVRAAVASGNRAALDEFVAGVHEQLSVEHSQWRSNNESTQAGLARLEAAIVGPRGHPAGEASPRPR